MQNRTPTLLLLLLERHTRLDKNSASHNTVMAGSLLKFLNRINAQDAHAIFQHKSYAHY